MIKYYLTLNDVVTGPYLLEQLQHMWEQGEITMDTPVCIEGATGWSTISSMSSVIGTSSLLDSFDTRPVAAPVIEKSTKSRGIYIILGLLFGQLGLHNFYAGRYSVGVLQMFMLVVITAVTLNLGTPMIMLAAVPFWALLEIIFVRKDGADLKMNM